MSKLGISSILLALGLNLSTVLLGTDYLWSVLLVFGGVGAFFVASGWKHFTRRDVWVIVTLLVFSDVMTVVIEKLMIHFDVWGFSDRTYRLMGINFLGAPIEEFIYWWLCPVVVAFAYIAHLRTDTPSGPTAFHALEMAFLAKWGTGNLQDPTADAIFGFRAMVANTGHGTRVTLSYPQDATWTEPVAAGGDSTR
ncbi:MAG TPA: hypothetical protein PKO15_09610 [Fibrobacteria bacterium]|nr:hypothetical protein [Fibrobacteria bacterium]HOX50796.1 hypothetical protein [Fibrobacteria bacterium]